MSDNREGHSTIELISILLKSGLSPAQLMKMGYSKSSIYVARRRLIEEKKDLNGFTKFVLRKDRGSFDIFLANLLIQALYEDDHLRIIDLVCRAYGMLSHEEQLSILADNEELKKLKKICTVCISLRNAYEWRSLDEHRFHVMLPIPSNKLKEYLDFLGSEALEYIISYSLFDNETEERISRDLKKRLFFNITAFSYYGIVTRFVIYALPIALRALRKLVETIDPSLFKEVASPEGIAIHVGKRKRKASIQ